MNILMVYPSWEERSALGFDKDIESTELYYLRMRLRSILRRYPR